MTRVQLQKSVFPKCSCILSGNACPDCPAPASFATRRGPQAMDPKEPSITQRGSMGHRLHRFQQATHTYWGRFPRLQSQSVKAGLIHVALRRQKPFTTLIKLHSLALHPRGSSPLPPSLRSSGSALGGQPSAWRFLGNATETTRSCSARNQSHSLPKQ